jgi:prepilin-type processing-associated H-X9-DG protein/prepilin-type N-terminal cleavage/methylation domain-containing protein
LKTYIRRSTFSRFFGQGDPSFTLVELLVVVAILGLLAGLLIPVTQKAIAAGKKGKASGYIYQIGVLINSYVSENNNCLPILINQNNMTGGSSSSDPENYQFWQNIIRLHAGISKRSFKDSNKDPWLPEIFYDPAVKKNNHPWGDFGGNDSIMLGIGQPAAKNCQSVFGHTRGTPLFSIGKLSQKVIVASSECPPGSSWGSSWYFGGIEWANEGDASKIPKPAARHGGKSLCLFADGHVEALDTKNMTSTDRKKYFVLPQDE